MRNDHSFEEISQINMVPFIDIVLVILVIFMVTAPMITSGIQVDLPQANGNPIESKDPPALVTLNKDGQYFLEYKEHKAEPLELAQLKQILTDAQIQAKAENKEFQVVIRGHNTRPYGDVIALMSDLQDAGLTQVGLLTEPLK